jgi:hypothetical protein
MYFILYNINLLIKEIREAKRKRKERKLAKKVYLNYIIILYI